MPPRAPGARPSGPPACAGRRPPSRRPSRSRRRASTRAACAPARRPGRPRPARARRRTPAPARRDPGSPRRSLPARPWGRSRGCATTPRASSRGRARAGGGRTPRAGSGGAPRPPAWPSGCRSRARRSWPLRPHRVRAGRRPRSAAAGEERGPRAPPRPRRTRPGRDGRRSWSTRTSVRSTPESGTVAFAAGMKALALAAAVLALAGCAGSRTAGPTPPASTRPARGCAAGTVRSLGTVRVAYAASAPRGAVAYASPGGREVARFAAANVNGYPTVFGAIAERLDGACRATWYRVQLPIRPNGARGWVRAAAVVLRAVRTRIVVSLSRRTLTLYRSGRVLIRTTVAVGAPATPTPTGRYYVNQLLVPDDAAGPYGPAALGVSAYSDVLTGWAQGGPIGIHGTNEPWSIGRAV